MRGTKNAHNRAFSSHVPSRNKLALLNSFSIISRWYFGCHFLGESYPRIVTEEKTNGLGLKWSWLGHRWAPNTRRQLSAKLAITTGESQRQRNTVYRIREIQLTDSEKYCFRRWARRTCRQTRDDNIRRLSSNEIICISAAIKGRGRHDITNHFYPVWESFAKIAITCQSLWWRTNIQWISQQSQYLRSEGYLLHD